MTTKWTIRKYPIRSDGSRPNCPWFVFDPVVPPPEDYENAFVFAHYVFHTFPEALAYLESQIRKARTVEIVLPKVEDWKVLPSKRQRVDQLAWGAIIRDTTSDYEDSGGYVYIDDSDLKPLAEYLLALHYEKENK